MFLCVDTLFSAPLECCPMVSLYTTCIMSDIAFISHTLSADALFKSQKKHSFAGTRVLACTF